MSGRGAGGAGAGAGDNDGFGDDDIQFDDLDFTDSFAESGDAEGAGAAFTDDVSRMKVALLNEKGSPELLPYEEDLLEDLTKQIKAQRARMKSQRDVVFAGLCEMEIDRVKYLMASYLRTRLRKLEKYAFHVLSNRSLHDRMSPAEFEFVKGYTDAKAQHLQRALLQHLPKNYQSLTEKYRQTGDAARDIDMIRKPKLDGVVFCRVVDDVGEYTVHDSDATADMTMGSSWIARYSSVQALVLDGRVQLA